MLHKYRRLVRRLVNLAAYLLPIIAAMIWYPRTIDDIGPMPLGFILSLGGAVVLVVIGDQLES